MEVFCIKLLLQSLLRRDEVAFSSGVIEEFLFSPERAPCGRHLSLQVPIFYSTFRSALREYFESLKRFSSVLHNRSVSFGGGGRKELFLCQNGTSISSVWDRSVGMENILKLRKAEVALVPGGIEKFLHSLERAPRVRHLSLQVSIFYSTFPRTSREYFGSLRVTLDHSSVLQNRGVSFWGEGGGEERALPLSKWNFDFIRLGQKCLGWRTFVVCFRCDRFEGFVVIIFRYGSLLHQTLLQSLWVVKFGC
ncbi:hypothetical protein CDAR_430631 [Caerostris darwini]|uniref:Maturase K n=1 Tax=Caerostris darwini TaxID=1538125 RepID=A0AAV4Q1K5_9ARAC|nr:hypothetical protein CDAR_430631 [Caerostris darwini]